MDFINFTNNWVKGEIFEAIIIAIFGLTLFIAGIAFWLFGTTSNAKSVILPLVVVGAIFIGSGVWMYISNQKRLVEYSKSFQENPREFVIKEKERVEGFMYMYPTTKAIATICFIVTLLAFWFTKSSLFHGIAIGLTIFGLGGLVIDYFSEERAMRYYSIIQEEQKK